MTTSSVIAAVLITAFAVSYGWGMRGCIIGGEKGALVPGALLGLSLALFTCSGQLKDFYPFFAAAGALGMTFGGIEPYAQTMAFILHRDKEPYKGHYMHGIAGIFLKGALWFAIDGAILGLLPAALSGEYSATEITVLFISLPIVSILGTYIINMPYNKDKGIFPKLYFSNGSREEWGGNLFVLIDLIIFISVRKNFFALGSAAAGLVAGGIGFVLGLLIYDAVIREHNGKYIFGKANRNGYIDGWKIMEHTLGTLGGAGISLWFCLNSEKISALMQNADVNNLYFGADKNIIGFIAVSGMLLLTLIQWPVKLLLEKKGKKVNEHTFELTERPLWAAFPMIFIFMGSEKAAFASAFFTISYALWEKAVFEWFEIYKGKKPVRIILTILFAASTVCFFVTQSVSPVLLTVLYTFAYTIVSWAYFFMPEKFRDMKNQGKNFGEYFRSEITVNAHFIIQSIILTVLVGVLS